MLKEAGFTLIELMLAIAISAILIAISYPLYSDHQVKAERNRAEIALMQCAVRMEKYFSQHASYRGATFTALHAENVMSGLPYQLQITSATQSHYQLQIIPTGAQKKRDLHCGTLSLSDTNERSVSGDGNVMQCWM
ncbi:MAG: hypothetical protein ACD_42C00506G0001 [uncultured bacterium]|nr:MAG: hypothetical protein ACD_42C00506G0001 [uncultured bacterium]OGT32376.1 MAG: hypothetical protein A3C44_06955 [Gammaproteobacteria bacterium RIFCSPHIGHO2_02_FULL_39_13]OGT48170.1 MAG: hypothetical protein A3E53_03170 [Gammaproteobacteria bacterium RIFCSPHIGHO2_12_FULL_39_24]